MLSDKVINLALDFYPDQNRSVLWCNSTHALRLSEASPSVHTRANYRAAQIRCSGARDGFRKARINI